MPNLAVAAVALCLVLTAAGRTESVAVRLVGGSDPRTGRLEVYSGGSWGAVCSDHFSGTAARFVCYMLGYGHNGRLIGFGKHRHFGSDRGPIWLDNLRCNGTETSLADCRRDDRGRECPDSEIVSVSCVPDSTDEVALVGGGSSRAGRLELFHGTLWGTVCDDGFTDAAARVVCYSLGFGRVGRKVDVDQYGAGDGLIWLSNLVCDGTEQYIGECSLTGGWTNNHNCTHRRDVAVSCTYYNSSVTTPVRLVGGSNSTGLLEVLHDGVWGTVCGYVYSEAASVVCRMLGFTSGSRAYGSNYTAGDGPIWLDVKDCGGAEADIAQCSHRGWGVHNCEYRHVVAISCVQRDSSEVQVRLNGGRDPRAGRLEVLYDGVWRSVCRDGFDGAAATVVCSMLGYYGNYGHYYGNYGHIGRPTSNNFGDGPGPSGLQSVQCSGTERSLAECARQRDWSLGNCSDTDEQAAVSCLTDGAVALFGSGHPREGRLEIYHNGSWGTVCDDGFDDAAARVVCHVLGFGYVGGTKSAKDYGVGTGTIWLDGVSCSGTESHLGMCFRRGWSQHKCGHDEDVAVLCDDNLTEPPYEPEDHSDVVFIFFGTFLLFLLCAAFLPVSLCALCALCDKLQRGRREAARTNPEPARPDIISDANAVP